MKTKKGISLIILVITIIVTIIIASTVIISLANGKIIDNANKVVEDADLAQVKTIAKIAFSKEYMKGAKTQEDFDTAVRKTLKENGVDLSKYTIMVTTNGVTVYKIGEEPSTPDGENPKDDTTAVIYGGWSLESAKTGNKVKTLNVKKEDQQIKVGTIVNYKAPSAKNYTGSWKILGVDELGRIKLMATESIGNKTLVGKVGFKSGINDLNLMCEGYADGVMAELSRSINDQDIQELTDFPKTTYGAGLLYEYGNVIKFSWSGTGKAIYSGTNGVTGSLTGTHAGGFTYYDETIKDFVTKLQANSGEITTLTGTSYIYSGATYLDNSTAAYKMVFMDPLGTVNTPVYWLASIYTYAYTNFIRFGVRCVNNGYINTNNLVHSNGGEASVTSGVRPVVVLKAGITLVKDGNSGSYNIV